MSESKTPVIPDSGKTGNDLFKQITQGPGLVSVLGVVVALVIGGLLSGISD